MALSRVERYLKMMNDIAKYKSKTVAKQFKIAVLKSYIENPKGLTQADIKILQEELDKLKPENWTT